MDLINSLKNNGILVAPTQDQNIIKMSEINNKFIKEIYPGFIFVPITSNSN